MYMEKLIGLIESRAFKSIEITMATSNNVLFEGRFVPSMVIWDNGLIDIEDHNNYLHLMIPISENKIDVIMDENIFEVHCDGIVFTIYL